MYCVCVCVLCNCSPTCFLMQIMLNSFSLDYEAPANGKKGHRRESAENRRTVRVEAKGKKWRKIMKERRKKREKKEKLIRKRREKRDEYLRNNPFFVPIASAEEGFKRRILGGGMNMRDEWAMRRKKRFKERAKLWSTLPRPRNVEAYIKVTTGSGADEANEVCYRSPLNWSTSETEVLLLPILV